MHSPPAGESWREGAIFTPVIASVNGSERTAILTVPSPLPSPGFASLNHPLPPNEYCGRGKVTNLISEPLP